MRRALTCIVLASMCSCNGAQNQATDTTAESTKQPDPPQPEPPRPPANTYVAPSPDELEALAAKLAEDLAAARQATDPEIRKTALERAVQLDPFDADTLTELGHSYVAAGQLPDAMHCFEQALRHSDDISQRAALLVELGTQTEVLGDLTRAAELVWSSALLQPNEAATTRLAALTGGAEVISHSICNWHRHGVPSSPQKLCPAYVEALGQPASTCVYEHPSLAVDANKRIELFSHLDPATQVEIYVVNAILDGVWYSSPLTWVSHPAAAHADENVARIDVRLEHVAPSPDPQVLFEWTIERRDIDPTTKLERTRITTNLGVLSVSLEPRWWLGLRTASSLATQPAGGAGEPTTMQTSVEVKWIPKTGDFELLRTEHSPGATLGATLGKFALGAYLLLCPSEIDGS